MPVDSSRINFFRSLIEQPFTQNIGEYGEDSTGHLVYHVKLTSNIDSVSGSVFSGDTLVQVHSVVFYRRIPIDTSIAILGDICDTVECPPVCLHWAPPDTISVPPIGLNPISCEETAAIEILNGINRSILECIDSKLTQVDETYRNTCGNADSVNDRLVVSYPVDYYHFTLYYYDRAGNLVKTVPPKGVAPLSSTSVSRMNHPAHTYVTEYEYNGLGQVIRQKTPDAGTVHLWYDQWGRPRFSQDQRQADSGLYSYVKYDRLGRVVESGASTDSISGSAFAGKADLATFPTNGSERTYIVYDTPSSVNYLDGTPQRNLRNRVSYVRTDDSAFTYYSYDVHGDVEWVGQYHADMGRVNYTKYLYELVSGNVNEVRYNEGRGDQFYHRYDYDRDNRLVRVKTSRDGQIWDQDARYAYYKHGPVRRREIGEDKLQGLDFTYTLQGSLKAVNHPSLTTSSDPGGDGASNTFAPDSFAVAVGHYAGDFTHAGSPIADSASSTLQGTPLYDGGISSATSSIGKTTPKGKFEGVAGEKYTYDQLQRITGSNFQSETGGSWSATTQYGTRYSYDANGNIDSLMRRAFDSSGSNKMDSLHYFYTSSTNKLSRVSDAVTGDPFKEDISNQSSTTYQYDGSGRLVTDNSTSTALTWYNNDRIKRMKSTVGSGHTITVDYKYDAMGNRVIKQVTDRKTGDTNTHVVTTHYVYDAAGNVMAIYEKRCEIPYDRDLDGVPDTADNCPFTPNSNQLDSDGDGIGDVCDNCPFASNPTQADADRDGKGDACDNATNYWNPVPHDQNNNGKDDATEVGGPQWDTDGDGFSDKIDPCPTVVNTPTNSTDSDGDGIPNICDNCPSVSNANQKDINKNTPEGFACEPAAPTCEWKLVEQPIYGAGREGVAVPDGITLNTVPPDTIFTRKLGQKLYELDDHLGNARVIISDRKLSDIVSGVPGNFRAEMKSYTNLYPFGMEQPGRYMNGDAYRYGYNGMEQDSAIVDDQYTTYFRLYDARLGRWLSIDPVTNAGESPYVAMGDNPISHIDPTGSDTTIRRYDDENGNHMLERNLNGDKIETYRWDPENEAVKGSGNGWVAVSIEEPGLFQKGLNFLGDYAQATGETIVSTPVNMITSILWGLDGVARLGGETNRLLMEGDLEGIGQLWKKSFDDGNQNFADHWNELSGSVSQVVNTPLGDHWSALKAAASDPKFLGNLSGNILWAVISEGAGGYSGKVSNASGVIEVSNRMADIYTEADAAVISELRAKLRTGKDRNIAFAEGNINGEPFDRIVGVSGRNTPGTTMPSSRFFETKVVGWDRSFDAEVHILETLAQRLQPSTKGKIVLVSELPYCESCAGVIDQFEKMFPNMQLVLVQGTYEAKYQRR
jgi:RHS repeat-associated protein